MPLAGSIPSSLSDAATQLNVVASFFSFRTFRCSCTICPDPNLTPATTLTRYLNKHSHAAYVTHLAIILPISPGPLF